MLLCVAFSSAALTLGRARGAVWLGQTLDVSIQVQYEEAESLASMCFEAEVFHADTRQDAGRVRVNVAPAAQAQTAQIRVQSSAAVDEPMVTVYLKENCLSKTTRRYVMLADVPSDALTTAAVAARASAPVTPDQPVAGSGTSAGPVNATPAAKPTTPRASVREKARPARPDGTVQKSPEPQKSTQTFPAKTAKPGGKPQLKLDPLTSLNERVAQLEEALLAANAGDKEAEAQRIQKVEGSVQALLALVAKNERGMAELRQQLQKAEAEKYDNVLVYGLLALLLLATGLLVYLWRRQQDRSGYADVWRGSTEAAPRMAVQSVVVPSRTAASGLATAAVAAAGVAAGVAAAPGTAAPPSMKSPTPEQKDFDDEPEPAAADLDLDDLIGTPAEPRESEPAPQALVIGAGSGSREEEEALPELPAVDGPSVAPQEPAAAIPEFPTVDPVHIDVSHLSLAPVEPAPAVAAEPMLDFDFSDLGKSEQKPDDAKKPQ